MPITFRLLVILTAAVLLLPAGCTRLRYRLPDDELSLALADDESQAPGRRPASFAFGETPPIGKVSKPSHFRLASFQQPEELPPPPPEPIDDKELPGPVILDNARDFITIAVPPRPPGLVKRLLRFRGCNQCSSCAHQEVAVPLSIETPLFSPSGEVYPPDRWWTSFGDANLDHQVEDSLGGSFTLAAALQRLHAAGALARREASDLWPDLNGFSEAEGTFRTFAPNSGFFALGLEASYEVDLWGQIHSRVEAEQLRASATEADYHAVALTLSAEIARTWFSLIEAHAQLKVLAEQLKTNLAGVQSLETRFGGGDEEIGLADVLRQRQLAESTREQIVIARSRVDVLEHRLAVLQGRPPQGATYEAGSTLPELPALPATGLPSELVQRRPDVHRDYLAILAADRDLAAAISDQYPRLNLAGSLTTLADSPAILFRDWILVIAGQLIGPIIDGGQRRAEVDRTSAVLHQLVADYGQSVLLAFSEVEDALALERFQRQRLESLNKQYILAKQAAKELRDSRKKFGDEITGTTYLDELTATIAEQQLQRDMLSARLDLILTRIALYVALAGSFGTCPEVIVDDSLPSTGIDERLPATAIIAELDADPDLDGRLRLHSRRGSRGDRGDQPDGANRSAD